MAVRLTCTDNASGHDGLRWRMGPDSESVDTVVGETAPGVGELVVNDPFEPEACFTVSAFSGSEESDAAAVCATTDPNTTDWSQVSIGDEVEGGIYAGQITYADERQFHLVVSLQSAEVFGLEWGGANTFISVNDPDDGVQNGQDMVATGGSFPALQHCLDYIDGEGNSDYYLGAINELGVVADNLGVPGHPEMDYSSKTGRTWSSVEADSHRARWRDLAGAQTGQDNKNGYLFRQTRPIRRVPV